VLRLVGLEGKLLRTGDMCLTRPVITLLQCVRCKLLLLLLLLTKQHSPVGLTNTHPCAVCVFPVSPPPPPPAGAACAVCCAACV
jgi:hypothetical protein